MIDFSVLANTAQAALAGSMEVISGSSVSDHHAPRIPRGPSLRRVSSRTAMKRSCSAPVLAPVWEPDCEELEDVPSFLHSDGVRRRLTCDGSAPTPSRSAPSTLHGPWSKVLLAVRDVVESGIRDGGPNPNPNPDPDPNPNPNPKPSPTPS